MVCFNEYLQIKDTEAQMQISPVFGNIHASLNWHRALIDFARMAKSKGFPRVVLCSTSEKLYQVSLLFLTLDLPTTCIVPLNILSYTRIWEITTINDFVINPGSKFPESAPTLLNEQECWIHPGRPDVCFPFFASSGKSLCFHTRTEFCRIGCIWLMIPPDDPHRQSPQSSRLNDKKWKRWSSTKEHPPTSMGRATRRCLLVIARPRSDNFCSGQSMQNNTFSGPDSLWGRLLRLQGATLADPMYHCDHQMDLRFSRRTQNNPGDPCLSTRMRVWNWREGSFWGVREHEERTAALIVETRFEAFNLHFPQQTPSLVRLSIHLGWWWCLCICCLCQSDPSHSEVVRIWLRLLGFFFVPDSSRTKAKKHNSSEFSRTHKPWHGNNSHVTSTASFLPDNLSGILNQGKITDLEDNKPTYKKWFRGKDSFQFWLKEPSTHHLRTT